MDAGWPAPHRGQGAGCQEVYRKDVRVYSVSRKIPEPGRDLVWDHGIKPKDAIHVATAPRLRVDAFETFDAKPVRKSGGVGDPPLAIREPRAAAQGRLNISEPE